MVPTHTPPTVGNSGIIFGIEYLIRVLINLKDDQRAASDITQKPAVLSLPLVVGTFPKADLSIDEDEEKIDAFENMNERKDDGQEASEVLAAKLKALNISSASLETSTTSVSQSSLTATPPSIAFTTFTTSQGTSHFVTPTTTINKFNQPESGCQFTIQYDGCHLQGRWQPHAYVSGGPHPLDKLSMETPLPPPFFETEERLLLHQDHRGQPPRMDIIQ